eukprot:scaffold18501_cov69-Phaeocystis_antarctica.AAC.5
MAGLEGVCRTAVRGAGNRREVREEVGGRRWEGGQAMRFTVLSEARPLSEARRAEPDRSRAQESQAKGISGKVGSIEGRLWA